MDAYLSVLTKRLRPQADEINAVSVAEGWCWAGGVPLAYPTPEEFEAEWALLEAELSAPSPAEPTMAELQAQIAELQQAMIDLLLMGGV